MTTMTGRPAVLAAAVATAATLTVGTVWVAVAGHEDHATARGPMSMSMNGSMPDSMMNSMRDTTAGEFSYLAHMIPHHEEAIAAARQLLARTQRSEMRTFAQTIITTQSAEVAQMKQWLAAWYPGRDFSVTYRPMMRDLSNLSGDALDRAFLQDMIPHHHMAVMMSQHLLNRSRSDDARSDHAEVRTLATSIRATQTDEIAKMQAWLRDWFGVTAWRGMMGSTTEG